jgi:hypothetical protein
MFLLHKGYHGTMPRRDRHADPCLAYPLAENERGSLLAEMSLSAIRDIAPGPVPELAPLCAPALAEEAPDA